MLDWSNFSPVAIPKSVTNKENEDISVLPDEEKVVGLKPVPVGPGKVFPSGYPTTRVVESAVVQGDVEQFVYDGERYNIIALWDDDRWLGFKVVSQLGTSEFKGVPINLEPEVLIRRHMNEKTGKTFINPEEIAGKAIRLQMSTNIDAIGVHGVADVSQVKAVLFPEGQTLLASVANQDLFLVTADDKVVDVATNPWPVDLDKAPDIRSQLAAPVKYNDTIGMIASCDSDGVALVRGGKPFFAAIEDLEAIMLPRDFRIAMAGGKS